MSVGEYHLRRVLRNNIQEMGEIDRLLEEHGPPRADDREGLKRWFAKVWAPQELRFDPEDGTPFTLTTSNPKSKWDYYRIGGDWTGMLGGYDPLEDIENWETCPECGGTGGRGDGLGLRRLGERRERACNGCAGKGWRAKCPAWFRGYEGVVQPVAGLLRRIEGYASGGPTEGGTPPQYLETYHPPVPPMVPFAVLVPNGEWYEDVETGPFGPPDDEPDAGEWTRTVEGILGEHEDCIAVVVDCHI